MNASLWVPNVEVEFAHLRKRAITYDAGGRSTTVDRRAALQKPPFADSAVLWAKAVELFYAARARGEGKGEPFIVVTNMYRQIGGGFR
jgi:hypothetical protein